MTKIKLQSTGQIYEIDQDLDLAAGEEILVEVDQVIETGRVICSKNCQKLAGDSIQAKFVRKLTNEDKEKIKINREKAAEYINKTQDKAFRHGLDMRVLEADMSFDEKKLFLYFTADGRIDFRTLVGDLVSDFHKIIRLQQVTARQEAKLFGGIGRCGRPLCCTSFLDNLEIINEELNDLQNIVGSKSSKMLGCCGKLMCCLSYENIKEAKSEILKENKEQPVQKEVK
jgi:cell fate regulator YaaT (PSP1 superfamily)